MKYAEVVVNVPVNPSSFFKKEDRNQSPAPYAWVDQAFTYNVPPALSETVRIGQMVWVPFGARRLQGIVVGLSDTTEHQETRELQEIVDTRPLLSPLQIELARWISHRYLTPLYECVWLMLPPGIEEKVETILELSGDQPPCPEKAQGALTDKQRELLELVGSKGIKSAQIAPNLRSAAEALVQRGYLTKRAQIKPAQARPKRVQAVRLIAGRDQIERELAKLRRRSVRAEIIEMLQGETPLAVDELCARLGCQPEAIRALAGEGLVQISPPQSAFSLTPLYYRELPALPERQGRVLVFLREHRTPARYDEIYDATGATPALLRALQHQGWIQKIEQGEMANLISSPAVLRPPSRLSQVVEFLEREDGPVWISAVYAATGATSQDLQKLERAGLIQLETEEIIRDPLAGKTFATPMPLTLTAEQTHVLDEIVGGFRSEAPCAYLLHGVTGSGKTEIYLQAIEEVLKRGKQAIALVPEIALTAQTIQRFGARFGHRIGVIHSELSHGERFDTWRRARDGKIDVVIGPRSALFAPLPRLGLIILDEEHEPSYKSEGEFRQPMYHTREVARELGRLNGASVILGSATPDVETYWRANAGEFKLLELPRRILAHGTSTGAVSYQELPPVHIVDLRTELREGNTSVFSRMLFESMNETLAAHAQVILFLNRRGTATSVVCRTCGFALKCPRCNNSYTVHQFGGETAQELVCHHCGKRGKMPRACPNCGSARLRPLGLGTEKLELAVHEQFPQARTLRWDWDVTRGQVSHEQILEAFTRGEADVLIGTQMIAKGLDLPRVTLVGVVNADTSLNLPDFRSSERTFQLLTQVAGRAGRSALGGKVIIQTYYPEHYAVAAAARHDYAGFYSQELRFRREAAYPPFRPLVRLLYSGTRETEARQASANLAAILQDRIRRLGVRDAELVGPAPAFFGKLGGRYRYHLLLHGQDARALLSSFPLPPGWHIDVDPVNLL